MPTYDFRCDEGHVTEARRGVDVESIPCPCGRIATRLSVYHVNVAGDVWIPESEGEYRNEAWGKSLKKQGWDAARSFEHLRKCRVETDAGWAVDMGKANACD